MSDKLYEYRIMAIFEEVYQPRSYKRKVVTSLEEANLLLQQAKDYYSNYKYLKDVFIERREVGIWGKML